MSFPNDSRSFLPSPPLSPPRSLPSCLPPLSVPATDTTVAPLDLSSPTTPSTSPFLLSLQIVRLVKRAKARVSALRSTRKTLSQDNRDICQAFEREVTEEIDKCLGRPTRRPFGRGRKGTVPWVTAKETAPNKNIEELLTQINASVTLEDKSLSTIAKLDDLFWKRNSDFAVVRLSFHELTELAVAVAHLLNTFKRASTKNGRVRTLCEGNELLDLDIDETCLANLQHLLRCLLNQLIRLIVLDSVAQIQRHISECQKDHNKHADDWFFEFPDARHPLSTTWPWSIKPSLAVLWGVCWMFYVYLDASGNLVDEYGNILPPWWEMQVQPQSQDMFELYTGNNFGPFQMPRPSPTRFEAPASAAPPLGAPQFSVPLSQAASTLTNHPPNPYENQAAAPHTAWPYSTVYPEAANEISSLPNHAASTYTPSFSDWPSQLPAADSQQAEFDLPQTRDSLTPRINTDISPSDFRQVPQDSAPFSSSSNSSMRQQEDAYGGLQYSTNLSPADARGRFMPQENNMNTPVSPVSGRSPSDGTIQDQFSRKRSHSQMRDEQPPQNVHHSRAGSAASGVQNEISPIVDDFEQSPRGSRTVKRGEAPTNQDGKYYCELDECMGQTFDRKCEWSKHMDKHDRPYRCGHPACGKLQGFTYSGGLLRHEREVHGKHGGPKTQLRCPYTDCKRHTGKGFTRKENLSEHIRRVHRSKSQDSQQPSQSDLKVEELQQAAQGAEQMSELMEPSQPAPIYTSADPGPLDRVPPGAGKRKRSEAERSPSVEVEDLKQEVKRLRAENADKDNRLRKMEAAVEALQRQAPHNGQGRDERDE